MILGNELLAFLAEDIPAMETDMEGKLRGGFSAFGDGGSMSLLGNVNCDCNCGQCTTNGDCDSNGNCDCNCKECTTNINCGKNCTPKSETKPGTGETNPESTTTGKSNSAFVGFGGSFLF